jgi:hypothetical protein
MCASAGRSAWTYDKRALALQSMFFKKPFAERDLGIEVTLAIEAPGGAAIRPTRFRLIARRRLPRPN